MWICDNTRINLNELAQDYICDALLKRDGLGPKSREKQDIIVAQIVHKNVRASWYAAINKTDEP